MKKLAVVSAGLFVTGSVAVAGAGTAMSDPQSDASSVNVVGEPYNQARKILRSQGVRASFGGSVGSALPQAECLVDSQKMNSNGKVLLMLDCSEEAAEQAENAGPSGGPTVGSNGVTTVTPTPVAPGQGAPPVAPNPGAPGAPPPA